MGEVTTIGLDLAKHVFQGARSSCRFGRADKMGTSRLGGRSPRFVSGQCPREGPWRVIPVGG